MNLKQLLYDKGRLKLIASNIILVAIGVLVGRFISGCVLIYIDNDDYANYQLDPKLARDARLFSSMVTVVSVCEDQKSFRLLSEVLSIYPGIKLLVGTIRGAKNVPSSSFLRIDEFDTKADALNELINKVDTEYFLHLDEYHQIDSAISDQSVGWLLQSLQKIISLDIVGGSLFVEDAYKRKYDALEIPCYRLHHYNYTYSETYEYKKSILDIMVCERTSTSFLANTTTFKQSGLSFDPRVKKMLFEDFFLQAKRKGLVIGTKPEVYFMVRKSHNKQRSAVQHVTTKFLPDLIPFGLKHQVMTVVDINRQILYICEQSSSLDRKIDLFEAKDLLCDHEKARKHWNTKHWSTGGMFTPPTVLSSLKRLITAAATFFDERKWTWTLGGDVALGAVKVRGLLPWCGGHINVNIVGEREKCLNVLRNEFTKQYPEYRIQQQTNKVLLEDSAKGMHGSGGAIAITFSDQGSLSEKVVRMNFQENWIPFSKKLFTELRSTYSGEYLQHKMEVSKEHVHCSEKSNACLPDFRKIKNGRGGIWEECFTES